MQTVYLYNKVILYPESADPAATLRRKLLCGFDIQKVAGVMSVSSDEMGTFTEKNNNNFTRFNKGPTRIKVLWDSW